MTFFEYLHVIRRRWYYVALGFLAGLTVGVLTAPGVSATQSYYQGEVILVVDPNSQGGSAINLDQAALLAIRGPVPERVKAELAKRGEPAPLSFYAEPDLDQRSLFLDVTASTPEGAAKATDLLAAELSTELANADLTTYNDDLTKARADLVAAQQAIAALDATMAQTPEDAPAFADLQSQKATAQSDLANAQATVKTLQDQGTPVPPVHALEAARTKSTHPEGWRLPESRPTRGVMLGIFGLILGALGALLADRLDTRVRGRSDAEAAFGLPVIAEIPPIPGVGRRRELLVATAPASPVVESYRALRAVVLFTANAAGGERDGSSETAPETAGQVILVTSPSAGEGKTTAAAHLAAVLAEFGQRTLLVSADFRRPRVHELFGVPRDPGLSDVLASGMGRVPLSDLRMVTSFPNVSFLPSGSPVDNPAQLLTETAHLVTAARSLFDYIVIDTPPLLVANDATELAAVADMVILVAKADRTSRQAARRSTDILQRVDAPLLGVVVSSAHDTPTAYGYYRNRYYAEADQGSSRRWFRTQDAQEPGSLRPAAMSQPADVGGDQ